MVSLCMPKLKELRRKLHCLSQCSPFAEAGEAGFAVMHTVACGGCFPISTAAGSGEPRSGLRAAARLRPAVPAPRAGSLGPSDPAEECLRVLERVQEQVHLAGRTDQLGQDQRGQSRRVDTVAADADAGR